MAIPVIDFSKLNGEERAKTLAQIANGCEEWGFFQVLSDLLVILLLISGCEALVFLWVQNQSETWCNHLND